MPVCQIRIDAQYGFCVFFRSSFVTHLQEQFTAQTVCLLCFCFRGLCNILAEQCHGNYFIALSSHCFGLV